MTEEKEKMTTSGSNMASAAASMPKNQADRLPLSHQPGPQGFASLYKSIQDGSNVGLDRIEAILNLFGMELKAVKRKEVDQGRRKNENQKQSKR